MEEYFKAVKVTENVYWVGAIDWSIRNFHGYETGRGSTYNAFLVLDEKITLIDSVKGPFVGELLARIRSVIGDVTKIDYIVSNHAEPDHSGGLPGDDRGDQTREGVRFPRRAEDADRLLRRSRPYPGQDR